MAAAAQFPIELAEELSTGEVRVLRAVLSEPTVEKAARAAKVSYATARRYLKRPHFRQALAALRAQYLELALSRLQAGTGEAVSALLGVLRDPESRPSDRIAASREILNQSLRAMEMLDLQEHLEALETHFGVPGVRQ